MKSKVLIFTASLLIVQYSQAQESTSKKGTPILPQKGDIAIGASATPFLDFLGNVTKINSTNIFSSTASMSFLEPSKMYIYGKYFIEDNFAIRGKLRIGGTSKTESRFVTKNGGDYGIDMVEDTWKNSTSNFFLSGGLEKRRGYGRLQGYYGAEAMFSVMGSVNDTYTYGNKISNTYKNPTRSNFNGNTSGGVYDVNNNTKSVVGLGLYAFIGVEYFIAPKISIGGEFGWGLGVNQATGATGKLESSYEYWDNTELSVTNKTDVLSGGTSIVSVDTRSSGGQIFIMFYF